MRYPDLTRLGGYASELRSALRRRREARQPRVRIRVGHAEHRVLAASEERAKRILELAGRLAGLHRPGAGGDDA